MKLLLPIVLTVCMLLFMPTKHYGQAPDLGDATDFAVFTAVGAFSNDGNTIVTGDIGTNVGAFTGFPPGIVIGEIHVADTESALAAADVDAAYMFLDALTCGTVLGTTLGSGQVLGPDIYCTGAATVLNGDLVLDAGGDPDAMFIFQFDGAFSTGTLSSVTLINGASICNVWWQVNGEFTLGDGSVFRGNLINNGAIHLLEASTVEGRVLSRAGAIDLHNNVVSLGLPAIAAVIVADGPTSLCEGDSVILSGNIDGAWNTGDSSSTITVTSSGVFFVVNTTLCGSDTSNLITVDVNALPTCTISGDLSICSGETTTLCVAAGFAAYLWSTGEITNCIDVSVAATYTVTVTDDNGCTGVCSDSVVVDSVQTCSITGDLSICEGESTVLCVPAGSAGYLWSTGEITNCITVSIDGIFSVTITEASGCISTCSVTVVVNPLPVCDITGVLSFCSDSSTILCALPGATGYLWNTGETTDCITVSVAGLYSVTVTDANGCTSECNETVAVIALPDCTISGDLTFCQGDSTQLCTLPGAASYLWSTGEITDCITVSAEGIYSVTVTDANGCTSVCSATVAFEISGPPFIVCPADVTINCEEVTLPVNTGTATASVDCNLSYTIDYSDSILAGSCAQSYTIVRTWTVTEVSGLTSSCIQNIIVQDITAPVITCAVVVSPIECGSIPVFGTPVVVDACDGLVDVTFITDSIPGSCAQTYSLIRTWTATDDCGNTSVCSITIEIQDLTSPVITCPVVISPIDCGSIPLFGTPVVTDVCDPLVSVTFVTDSVPALCGYSLVRTWTATDDCGNTAACSVTIVVQDVEPPVITLPAGFIEGETMFVQCYGQDPNWDIPSFDENNITAIDDCDPDIAVTFSQVLESEGDCTEDGFINLFRLTWTATDVCGNSSNAFLFLALVDTIAPVIFGVPADITVNCDAIPSAPILVYALDECLCACVVLVQDSAPLNGCVDGQVMVRSWTAQDRCGNVTVATQNITLISEEGPSLQLLPVGLAGMTDTLLQFNCSTGGIPEFFDTLSTGAVIGLSTCGVATTVTMETDVTIANNCNFSGFIEQRTFTWEANDACGNASAITLTVQLIDDEAPVFVDLPEFACVGDLSLGDVEAIDNCGDAAVRFWDVSIPNPCGDGLAVRRTYEAYDKCGNITSDSVTLIPNIQTEPIIEFIDPEMVGMLPGEMITIDCDAHGPALTPFGLSDVFYSGACATGVVVVFSERIVSESDCFTTGVMAVMELKWTATDICGNVSELIVMASVVDQTSPVFENFISDISIGCDDELPGIFAADNCGDVTITILDSIITGHCEYMYDVRRLITAVDPCGNTITRVQTVHVGGNGPVLEGIDEEICDDLSIPVVTAFDVCTGQFVDVTMTEDTLDNVCRDGLVIERIWSAVDTCGNVSTIRQIIIMNDQTPPEIMVPSYSVINFFMDNQNNQVFLSQAELLDKLKALDENSVFILDECDQEIIATLTVDTIIGDCNEDGYSERRVYTWLATDVCDNTASVSFTIDIIDDMPPVMTDVANDTTIVCEPLPIAPVVPAFNEPGVTVVFTETMVQGETSQEFIVTRTWTATDTCGNVSIFEQRISWTPNTFLECDFILPETFDCNSHGVIIGSNVTGGVGPFQYEWEIVGEKCFIQGGQGTPEITIYVGWSDVKVILTITDAFGCVSMCMFILDCQLSLQPMNFINEQADPVHDSQYELESHSGSTEQLRQFNLWPNPADDMINVSFESAVDHEVEFSLVNFFGQTVLTDKTKARIGLNIHQLNVGQIAAGGYILQIKSNNEVHTSVIPIVR